MGIFNFFKKKTAAGTAQEKKWTESDNLGTRHETMSQAVSYWTVERPRLSVKPPFTMFIMPNGDAAVEAMLELPFIHKAEDSGKLICERMMTFGCYEITNYGKPTGQYEVMIAGNDLTLAEFRQAEEIFTRCGGSRKNSDAPSANVKASVGAGDASKVRYSETVRGNDGVSVYEVYKGPDKASAFEFLKTKPVSKRLYYVVVDTPQGSFGRDINGFYQE